MEPSELINLEVRMMNVINAFINGLFKGHERAKSESYRRVKAEKSSWKIVEPNYERVVTFETAETNEFMLKDRMKRIEDFANKFAEKGVQYSINGSKVSFTFPNVQISYDVRKNWE